MTERKKCVLNYDVLEKMLATTWNPKHPYGCLVNSNHFLCKDWVHHPIDSQPFINGWPWGSRYVGKPYHQNDGVRPKKMCVQEHDTSKKKGDHVKF